MLKSTTVLFIAILLSACQGLGEIMRNSPYYYYAIPTGSKLVLNQPITIAPDSLKTYLQDGRLSYGPNQYYPFCKLELRQLTSVPRIVEPDVFEIYRIRREADYFSRLDPRYLFASIDISDSADGKPSPIIYATLLDLRSARQPAVFRLTCGHRQDPTIEARYLTIEQIRQALGDLFTLQPAESAR